MYYAVGKKEKASLTIKFFPLYARLSEVICMTMP